MTELGRVAQLQRLRHVIDLGPLAHGLALYKAENRQFSMSWMAEKRYAWGSNGRIGLCTLRGMNRTILLI